MSCFVTIVKSYELFGEREKHEPKAVSGRKDQTWRVRLEIAVPSRCLLMLYLH